MTDQSNRRSKLLKVGLTILGLLLAAYLLIPSLMRTRIATKVAPSLQTQSLMGYIGDSEGEGGDAGGVEASELPERKVVRTASLRIVVDDVPKATAQIEALARNYGGYVEKTEISQSKGSAQHGQILIRVPVKRFDDARAEIKKLASLVESDKTEARDVTKDFVDSEARLRNYQAEERQYLEIMKRAARVEDTLAGAERLSNVRGRIERLQAELKYLSQQVEMASVSVGLWVESTGQSAQWRPWYQTKLAFAEMVEGLIDFADSMLYFVLMLPVIALWVAALLFLLVLLIRILAWVKRKFWPTLARSFKTS